MGTRGKGIIVGRRCPKIQRCPSCGQMRGNHPNAAYYVCPVLPAVTAALRRFRANHGARWKSLLLAQWKKACADISGQEERCLLQQARNQIGPRRLYTITL